MYFWKVDQLVDDFKSEKVSQKEEFKYMLLFTVLITAMTDPFLYIGSSYNLYDSINSVSMLVVSILGVYYCYKINSEGDNKNFIVRIMCIGLPVMVRVLAFMIPVLILGSIIEEINTEETIDSDLYETSIFMVIATVVFVVSYYLYLAKKIRAVSSPLPA